jgi:hypothetical protein
LSFRFLTEFTTPTFITRHNSLPNITILVNNAIKPHQHSTRCSLCSAVEKCATNFEQIFLSCKSLSKICLAAFLPTPRRSPSSLIVIRLSCIRMVRVFSTF